MKEGIYRRNGNISGGLRPPRHVGAHREVGPRHHLVRVARAPLRVSFGLRVRDSKIENWVFVSSNSENISLITFLKSKKAENRQLTQWHLVNRLGNSFYL